MTQTLLFPIISHYILNFTYYKHTHTFLEVYGVLVQSDMATCASISQSYTSTFGI